MAYSDYGGYAYKNGERVEERSDFTITPDGDGVGTPGSYPGFSAVAAGLPHEEVMKFVTYPCGHAVLGDQGVYLLLRKQSYFEVYKGFEKIDVISLLDEEKRKEPFLHRWEYEGKSGVYIEEELFRDKEMIELNFEGHKIKIWLAETDNYYQYAMMEQPDGTIWTGFAGYGVGAGLEDADYGFSTQDCVDHLFEIFPVNKK